MKIALIAEHAHSHEGVGGAVTALAIALSAHHEVTLLSAGGSGLCGSAVRHCRVWAIGSYGLLFSITFFISSTIVLWWWRLKGEKRFHIIHSHCYHLSPFVDLSTSHYCEQEGIAQLRCQTKDTPRENLHNRLRARVLAFLEKRLCGRRRSKPLIVLSESMKRGFIRLHGTPAEKIFVIPNGVDPARYSPANGSLIREEIRRRYSLSDHDVVVLFVGGYWARKGVAQMIEALSLIHSHHVKLLIVGTGDRSRYQALSRARRVEDRVIFAGLQKETWQYYAASDIFLLPSLYEPFGLVVLEAMATGLPVVTSRQTGVAELIRDGIDGLLLEDPQDVADIAAKLELLLADAGLRRRLGENARRVALQYTWFHVAERTVEVYQQRMLDDPPTVRPLGDHLGPVAEGANRHAA